ncbi:hypothetical protein TNCV_462161 [Trichonephila clavipes]|uniref:DUF4371 domain-containing protein n=1 Tax=Trichonephila clavipes TaxID=2585209 RepID=A0A8X6UP04_TRICX|nr:hypothetical protein TNCV_462161 [Trichonephila clavipes]
MSSVQRHFQIKHQATFKNFDEKCEVRMQEISTSVRTVERIMQMVENVTAKQNSGLQEIVAFSIAVDENTDMNDVAHPTVIAQYCDKDQIY